MQKKGGRLEASLDTPPFHLKVNFYLFAYCQFIVTFEV